jgi:1,4-alpha-glucan branching enzyme
VGKQLTAQSVSVVRKEIDMLKKRYVKSRKIAKVTFELPAAELPEGIKAESVYLVGEFNDWDSTATLMPRAKGGTFRVTLELEPGREYQFRYLVNGEHWHNDWQADAYVPGGLGEDNCVVVTPAEPGAA